MKKLLPVLIAGIFSIVFVSCQKGIEPLNGPSRTDTTGTNNNNNNNNTGAGSIIGTWKFVGLNAQTSNTTQLTSGSDVSKTITTSDYTTENNTGTVVIDASRMTTSSFSYSVNTIAKSAYYENGVLIDTFSMPFQVTLPPGAGSTAPYKRIGSDSLYFESGFAFMNDVSQSTQPSGAKIKLEQNKLYFTQKVYQATSEPSQGGTLTTIIAATVKVTLERQ